MTRPQKLLRTVLPVAGAVLFIATVPYHRDWFDLYIYYGTVDDWIRHGGRIYDYLRPGTGYGFTYPPFAAVCMLPMLLVGRTGAVVGCVLLSAAASVLLLRGPLRELPLGRGGLVVTGCLFVMLEPVRDTFSLGQVNLLLMALVYADGGRGRFGGVGIGLAAAFKLTPAVFIGYLLLTGRRRAAAVATGTALAATALGVLAAPRASWVFWTRALWDTHRVGALDYVSNQSLQGALARLGAGRPVWVLAVLAVLVLWAYRVRRATAVGDDETGMALTGLAACLVSPVTWVHHLVWAVPAVALLARTGRRAVAAVLYVVLCSSVVWLWRDDPSGVDGFLGGSTYVWICLGLLALWPQASSRPPSRSCAGRADEPGLEAAP
ncbi:MULTISPECIES: glycosyltransferase 87 family protein [unclassified Streptomyces]|uniref:glycosyltransferase 87 family protein n=2 Tax=unclassified Streptomyces TaxID=2593676 RepID=UPI000883FCDB|nr:MULTISPECIES: glycosyltransferase 87 family protein [unclassified Streptomyces]MDX2733013.1 glycosyltransferase 87 family protein [Streptomyces sp. PA03-2a]SCX94136.1 alpha-1,2-mannosyltransferase [Streptomyces sp. 136MFCol5.1]